MAPSETLMLFPVAAACCAEVEFVSSSLSIAQSQSPWQIAPYPPPLSVWPGASRRAAGWAYLVPANRVQSKPYGQAAGARQSPSPDLPGPAPSGPQQHPSRPREAQEHDQQQPEDVGQPPPCSGDGEGRRAASDCAGAAIACHYSGGGGAQIVCGGIHQHTHQRKWPPASPPGWQKSQILPLVHCRVALPFSVFHPFVHPAGGGGRRRAFDALCHREGWARPGRGADRCSSCSSLSGCSHFEFAKPSCAGFFSTGAVSAEESCSWAAVSCTLAGRHPRPCPLCLQTAVLVASVEAYTLCVLTQFAEQTGATSYSSLVRGGLHVAARLQPTCI